MCHHTHTWGNRTRWWCYLYLGQHALQIYNSTQPRPKPLKWKKIEFLKHTPRQFLPEAEGSKHICYNKANLGHLIAATSLVILLKFDPNHRFFSPCDLCQMTSKCNRAPLLYYIKLCASFQLHQWIQTEVTVRKRSIQFKIGDFLSHVTLKFDGWPWKTIGHLF